MSTTPQPNRTIFAGLLIFAMLSSAALAGGYKANVAYGGSFGIHRYAFKPNPDFEKYFTPTRSVIPRAIPATEGEKNLIPTGNRNYYRQYFQTQSNTKPGEMNAGAKLGTAFPKSLFNKDIGKGRELSRIFKP